MTTEAERFLYDLGGNPSPGVQKRRRERLDMLLAEARAAALAEVRAKVERLPGREEVVYAPEHLIVTIDRAAVLALLDAPAPSEPGLPHGGVSGLFQHAPGAPCVVCDRAPAPSETMTEQDYAAKVRQIEALPARVVADTEALMTAASGYHNGWWNHDQQDGHTNPEWLACDAWACSALRAALLDAPAPSEPGLTSGSAEPDRKTVLAYRRHLERGCECPKWPECAPHSAREWGGGEPDVCKPHAHPAPSEPGLDRTAEVEAALAEVGLPLTESVAGLIRHHRNDEAAANGGWKLAYDLLKAKTDAPAPMSDDPAPQFAVDEETFVRNAREALEMGYNRCCAHCGVGTYDDSDLHERGCPEYVEVKR